MCVKCVVKFCMCVSCSHIVELCQACPSETKASQAGQESEGLVMVGFNQRQMHKTLEVE